MIRLLDACVRALREQGMRKMFLDAVKGGQEGFQSIGRLGPSYELGRHRLTCNSQASRSGRGTETAGVTWTEKAAPFYRKLSLRAPDGLNGARGRQHHSARSRRRNAKTSAPASLVREKEVVRTRLGRLCYEMSSPPWALAGPEHQSQETGVRAGGGTAQSAPPTQGPAPPGIDICHTGLRHRIVAALSWQI